MFQVLVRDKSLLQENRSLKIKNQMNSINKFDSVMDKSIRENKSLKNDIEENAIQYKKKELSKLSKKIDKLDNKVSQLGKQELEKHINVIKELFNFLTQNIEDIEQLNVQNDDSILEITDELWDSLNDFLNILVLELQNTNSLSEETNAMMEHAIFILEGMPLSNINQRQEQVLIDFTQKLNEFSQNISQQPPIQNMEIAAIYNHIETIDNENKRDSTLESIEYKENINVLEKDNSIELEGFEFIEPEILSIDESLSEQVEFSQDQENKIEAKFSFQDERTFSEQDNASGTREEDIQKQVSVTLESMDAELSDAVKVENSEWMPVIPSAKSESISSAQRMYTAFSSAVTRVQVEALMQNLSAKAAVVLHDGGSELRMKLTPPELGQMKLTFITEDGLMQGKVIVETQEAKNFFEQNIDNLRQSLAESGIDLGSVDVELGNHQDFSEQQEEKSSLIKNPVRQAITPISSPRERVLLSDSIVDYTA